MSQRFRICVYFRTPDFVLSLDGTFLEEVSIELYSLLESLFLMILAFVIILCFWGWGFRSSI
jgi:hypothetical protein